MRSIIKAGARRGSIPQAELGKISGRAKLQFLKDAISHIVGEVEGKDSTLGNTWKKTMATATSELAQLPATMSRLMQKPGSFGTFFGEANKFVVWNNHVYSFGLAGALVKDAMEEFVAYKIGLERAGKGVTKIQKQKRAGKPAVNIANVSSTISTIISTY
jgi:hypothetical protein